MSALGRRHVWPYRRSSRNSWELALLPDAEGAEDQIEDVVGGGGAGDGVERLQGVVEIEQQHFVGNFICYRAGGGVESGE